MEYKLRAKNRRIKRLVLQWFQLIKFKSFHLSLWWKISAVWAFITLFSLINNWIYAPELEIKSNAFWANAWGVWYTLLMISFISLFLIFSFHKKQKIKLWTDLNFRDYNALIIGGVMSVLLSVHVFMFISWYQSFSSSITHGNGPIIALIGWILSIFWWIILKKESKNQNQILSINDIWYDEKEQEIKENMKLPF